MCYSRTVDPAITPTVDEFTPRTQENNFRKVLENTQRVWFSRASGFNSQTVFVKSFCKSQFPHKSVNLFVILVMIKDKLTDLWGS